MKYNEVRNKIKMMNHDGVSQDNIQKCLNLVSFCVEQTRFKNFGAFPGMQEDMLELSIYVNKILTINISIYPNQYNVSVDNESVTDG